MYRATIHAALLAASLVALPLTAQSTVAVVEKAHPAVVTLKVYNAAGNAVGQGSGFFVGDGRIVTNTHVVGGAARVDVFGSEGQLLGSVPHVEAFSSTVDIAVLPSVGDPPGVLMLDGVLPQPGAPVIAIGAPLGLSNTVSTGVVSAVRQYNGVSYVQVTAPISPGSSGGPVLNERGDVIGVAVAMRTDGQSINFAVPARDVVALLGSPPGQLPFPFGAGIRGEVTTATSIREDLREIAPGEIVRGTLRQSDYDPDLDAIAHIYWIEGIRGERIVLELDSNEFDAEITMASVDDTTWARVDDDGGGSTNSRLAATLPNTGSYVVVASAYGNASTGRYTLRYSRDSKPTSQRGDEWVFLADFDDSVLYYIPSSLRRSTAGTNELWVRWEYMTTKTTASGREYDAVVQLTRIDCKRRRVGIASATMYSALSVVDSYDTDTPSMTHVIPGSVGMLIMDVACTSSTR